MHTCIVKNKQTNKQKKKTDAALIVLNIMEKKKNCMRSRSPFYSPKIHIRDVHSVITPAVSRVLN